VLKSTVQQQESRVEMIRVSGSRTEHKSICIGGEEEEDEDLGTIVIRVRNAVQGRALEVDDTQLV